METNLDKTYIEQENGADEVLTSCNNIVDTFSKEYNISDEISSFKRHGDKKIAREFPNKDLSLQVLAKFMYDTVSTWDKICFILSIIGIALLGLLIPVLTHIIVSPTLQAHDIKILKSAAIFLCSIYISKLIFEMIYSLVIKRISLKVGSCMRFATMSRILSLSNSSLKAFHKDTLGQYVFIVDKISRKVIESIFATAALSATSFLLIFQIRQYAEPLVWPFVLMLLIVVVLSIILMRTKQNYVNKELKDEIFISGFENIVIKGIKKIKIYGAEKRVFSSWANKFSENIGNKNNKPKSVLYSKVFIICVELFSFAVFYSVAALNGVLPANFYVFLIVYAILIAAINVFLSSIIKIGDVYPVYKKLKPFFYAKTEVDKNKEKVDKLYGHIVLNNLKFRYSDDDPLILNGINLDIRPGQYIAVVGRTGCGKSTLIKLLTGFETPTQGGVFYDDKDLSTLDLSSVRKNIGVVMQDGKLISGSILENITIANPAATMKEAYKAAKIAGILEDICAMPMGMNTIVSDESSVISGGQKQRILIARSLINNPNVIIFDEATSALDNNIQREISNSLEKMGVTRIVVAHRLSTIKGSDKIIVLENGKIAEEGSYQQLIDAKGLFCKLIEMQRL